MMKSCTNHIGHHITFKCKFIACNHKHMYQSKPINVQGTQRDSQINAEVDTSYITKNTSN